VFAGAGGTIGIGFAHAGATALAAFFAEGSNKITAGVAVLSGVALGIVPAMRVARLAPANVLKGGSRGITGSRGSLRLGRALVVVQNRIIHRAARRGGHTGATCSARPAGSTCKPRFSRRSDGYRAVYDYTPTRSRDGPAKFLEGYTGYLQGRRLLRLRAFFQPARGLIEVGCWMRARRYFFKALDSDQQRMGPALHLIRRVYGVEETSQVSARHPGGSVAEESGCEGGALGAEPVGGADPLSPGRRSGDRQWRHRAGKSGHRHRRGNWTFFGSDNGGKRAAVLLSFIAMCKRNAVKPFAWFREVLSRIAAHPIHRIEELLPHNWKPLAATAQAEIQISTVHAPARSHPAGRFTRRCPQS